MLKDERETNVTMIEVDNIRVVNPRTRNKKKFKVIVENIHRLGLKKPITVSRSESEKDGWAEYDLVCGQGRLEAFKALGESAIPAIVVSANEEDRFIMSLAENLARRQPTRFEHIKHIMALKEKGYTIQQIADKVDMTKNNVAVLVKLYSNGEERLLKAVEKGSIPIYMAVQISTATDTETQKMLTEAYESGKLRGQKLMQVKGILEERRRHGKQCRRSRARKKNKKTRTDDLVRHYQQEVNRQKLFVKKAKLSESRLLFIVQGMRELFSDDNFINLMRAEKLDTLPKYLGEQIKAGM